MSTATLEEIAELRALCDYYDLEGRQILARYLNSELLSVYNGAGPDSWHDWSRKTLTAVMRLYQPVVLIHDVQFHESDGTLGTFDKVVADWKRNTRKIFDAEYPLWTWRMLRPSCRAERAYWYSVMQASNLSISGDIAYAAWQDAYERRLDKGEIARSQDCEIARSRDTKGMCNE